MEACEGSVLTGLQTTTRWWAAFPLTHRLPPGLCLPTPCRDVNRPGRGQRGTAAPSNGWPITLANPGHARFANPQQQHIHCQAQAGAFFSLLPRTRNSPSGVLETRGPALGTVDASGLWKFCARRVLDASHRVFTAHLRQGSSSCYCHSSYVLVMAYALQDSDFPLHSTAPGSGYSWGNLPTDRGPCCGMCSAPTTEPPHTVCSGTMQACEKGGPPPISFF